RHEQPPRPPKPPPEQTQHQPNRPQTSPSLRRPCVASTKRTDSSGARCPASNPSSAPSPGPQTGGHGRCTTPGSTPSPRTLWSTSTTELESDMSEPIPREPRRDDTAADVGTLVRLGREDPQPVPAPSIQPFLEPDWPPDDEPA